MRSPPAQLYYLLIVKLVAEDLTLIVELVAEDLTHQQVKASYTSSFRPNGVVG